MRNKVIRSIVVIAVSLIAPLSVLVAGDKFKVDEILVDIMVEESIAISQTQFDLSMKPGESETHTFTLSNSADVITDVELSVSITPANLASQWLTFTMPVDHALDKHSTKDISFTAELHPAAPINDYRVTIEVLRTG